MAAFCCLNLDTETPQKETRRKQPPIVKGLVFHPDDCMPKPSKSLSLSFLSLSLPLLPTLCSSSSFKTVCIKLSVIPNYISEQTLPTCFLVLIFIFVSTVVKFVSIYYSYGEIIYTLILSPKITTYSLIDHLKQQFSTCRL